MRPLKECIHSGSNKSNLFAGLKRGAYRVESTAAHLWQWVAREA